MALDLTIYASTEAESSDQASVSVEDLSARITPNNSFSCTPRSSSAAEQSSVFRNFPSNPWSSENSPRATPNSNSVLYHEHNFDTVSSNPTKRTDIPIVTPKSRDALRNRLCEDQETMEEEILQLKRSLLEKDMELRRRKVHVADVEAENRRLTKEIEALQLNSNVKGQRTRSHDKLRTKIGGMKVMLEEAYNTCELQSIELYQLRRDVCLTRSRELEAEKNVYASEVHRLQEVIKKLKLANGRIGHDNRMIGRLKAKNHHLEVMNLRLSSCLSTSLSQTSRAPKTPKSQPQRDPLVWNSFSGFDYIQQQQQHENACSNRSSVSQGGCLPR